ncbi:MAG: Cys-tRNA(Pro) deacylase [Dialister sp.]|nr:Cys-tRNA(Pro) deacylase [Dialister sp.]
MKKEKKTNVMRMLDKANIPYETKSYAYTEEDLSGVHAAEALGCDPDMVFKTIVVTGDKTGPVVFCLPSEKELDLKIAARVSGNKSATMIHVKDLPAITGYIRGGCSPIGMKKQFPTYIDSSCFDHEKISISAGQRGQQVLLHPENLIACLNAIPSAITRREE